MMLASHAQLAVMPSTYSIHSNVTLHGCVAGSPQLWNKSVSNLVILYRQQKSTRAISEPVCQSDVTDGQTIDIRDYVTGIGNWSRDAHNACTHGISLWSLHLFHLCTTLSRCRFFVSFHCPSTEEANCEPCHSKKKAEARLCAVQVSPTIVWERRHYVVCFLGEPLSSYGPFCCTPGCQPLLVGYFVSLCTCRISWNAIWHCGYCIRSSWACFMSMDGFQFIANEVIVVQEVSSYTTETMEYHDCVSPLLFNYMLGLHFLRFTDTGDWFVRLCIHMLFDLMCCPGSTGKSWPLESRMQIWYIQVALPLYWVYYMNTRIICYQGLYMTVQHFSTYVRT